MATLVLTALGTAIGGPLGAAVGGLLGNTFDQSVLFKPKGREGRRLGDLQVQTSTYGAQIARIFGMMRVAGTVIWATDLKEQRHKSGGGKGRPSVTSYSYSASFAVALSARPIRSVKRIWADGNLLRGVAGDFKTELGAFRVHPGGEDQAVDPLIASAQGVARTPAHRGVAYVVFEDLQLADYGNRIPSLTFEVEADEGPVSLALVADELTGRQMRGAGLGNLDGLAAGGSDVAEAIAPVVEACDLALTAGEDGLWLRGDAEGDAALVGKRSLCRRVNGRAVEPMERSSGAADGVPVALSLRHYDPARDYQAGVQRVTRPGPGRMEQGIDLPAVLSGQEARTIAARRLGHAWPGRATMTLRCGWDGLRHAAGDIVVVNDVPGRWRVEEREWEAMAVRLALRRVGAVSGELPGDVSSGAIVREADAPHGPTSLMLLDLPSLREDAAVTPLIVAAASGTQGWRGAALFAVSDTAEATPVSRTAPRAIMGRVDQPLPPGSVVLKDEVNVLPVTLLADDMDLADADEAALGIGRNLCLVGRELIQFERAIQTGPRSFSLEGLRRGVRGTEWAMADHGQEEPFLLIEAEHLAEPFAELPGTAEIGRLLKLAAVGIGDVAPVEAAITVSGEAVTPLPPVHLRAAADGEGGWNLRWTRRSRSGWRWSNGTDVPLGEESERYEVRIVRDGAPIRRQEVEVGSWTYDAGMVAAEGAGEVTVEVRQVGSFALGRPASLMLSI